MTDPQPDHNEIVVQSTELRDQGVVLPAVAYRPTGRGAHPGVVVAPGGLAVGVLDAYRWAGERLALAGYLALVPTYRAASPYDDVADLTLALDWLEREADVDEARLSLLGHSRGGIAALRAAAIDARVRAVIAIAPVVDTAQYVRSVADFAPSARDGIVQFMGGTPEEIPDRYASVRVLGLVERIPQPVLLIHGTADMRVPLEHSLWLERALREVGNERVRLEVVNGMGHFLELTTLGYQFERVTDLVTTWLGDVLG